MTPWRRTLPRCCAALPLLDRSGSAQLSLGNRDDESRSEVGGIRKKWLTSYQLSYLAIRIYASRDPDPVASCDDHGRGPWENGGVGPRVILFGRYFLDVGKLQTQRHEPAVSTQHRRAVSPSIQK
jgi:hypothetical protein